MRYCDRLPSVGESVTLPEFGGDGNPLEVVRITANERRGVSVVLQRDHDRAPGLQCLSTT